MPPLQMLIAGATGVAGRSVAALAAADGHRVRTLSRDPARAAALREAGTDAIACDATRPGDLARACEGIEVVVSALGGSVNPSAPERRSYFDVDRAANLNLIASAVSAGVRRFVYVAVHVTPAYDHVAYVRAHEEVVETLRHAGIEYGVIRPTGLFPAFDDVLGMARRGFGLVIGDGRARTNPLHPDDLARVVLNEAVSRERSDRSVGGPDVLTRREIAELAARAWGRTPRVWSLPSRATRVLGRLASRRSARLGELFQFAAAVSITDCVAPSVGTRRLADYFEERVAERRR